jgi:hypothetical protein
VVLAGLLAVALTTGVREQNSVRIATEIFIVAAVVLIAGWRLHRVRKNRTDKAFFDEMDRTTHRDPPRSGAS